MADNEAIARGFLTLKSKDLILECKARGLKYNGTKAQMVDRLIQSLGLSREALEAQRVELLVDPIPVHQHQRILVDEDQPVLRVAPPRIQVQEDQAPQVQHIAREVQPVLRRDELQSRQLESVLNQIMSRMERMEQRVAAQEDLSAGLVSEVSSLPVVDSSLESRKYWPDIKFKNFNLSQEYEIFQKIGRLSSSIQSGDVRNFESIAKMAKQIEDVAGLQALKIVLIDRGEENIVNYIRTDDKGTFLEQYSGMIKEGRKFAGSKRKEPPTNITYAERFPTNVAHTERFGDNQQPFQKRQKPLQCWTCGKFGHTKFNCDQKKKLDQGNGSKPAFLPPKT